MRPSVSGDARRTRRRLWVSALALALLAAGCAAPSVISTVIGGPGRGDALKLTQTPGRLHIDGSQVYVADQALVRRIDLATGSETVFAGIDTYIKRYDGDGMAASSSALMGVGGIATDHAGNQFICDSARLRKVDPSGTITTVAGTGTLGHSGDGGQASNAQITCSHLGIDGSDRLYIGESHQVRRIDEDGTITTVAGNGTSTASGDGGPAVDAGIDAIDDMDVDGIGRIVIVSKLGERVRLVYQQGSIRTLAGTSTKGFAGDGGPATAALLAWPQGVAFDPSGRVLIADYGNIRIRRVENDGTIGTIAGIGPSNNPDTSAPIGAGSTGDGGPAESASLSGPMSIDVGADGTIVFGEYFPSYRIRVIWPNGTIDTIANKVFSWGEPEEQVPALNAQIYGGNVAVDDVGNEFVVSYRWLREVGPDRSIASVSGATSVGGSVLQVALAPDGTPVIATTNCRVLRVDHGGALTPIAGTGVCGATGDGGPAVDAQITQPSALAFDSSGNLFIAQLSTIRRVDTDGTITTSAGTGGSSSAGDGGPATDASFSDIRSLTVDGNNDLFVLDHYRIRRIDTNGTINAFAGSTTSGFAGDGGPASGALFSNPQAIAADSSGNVFVADTGNKRVRRIRTDGTVSTIAGNGTADFSGDGGPPGAARLWNPNALAVDRAGALHVVDGDRVRQIPHAAQLP